MRTMSKAGLLNPEFYLAAQRLGETFPRVDHDKTWPPARNLNFWGVKIA